MICELHWPTLSCSYALACSRAVSHACGNSQLRRQFDKRGKCLLVQCVAGRAGGLCIWLATYLCRDG